MITPGTILMESDAPHPQFFQLEDHSHPNHWMSVKDGFTPHEFEKELAGEGWTFFYMASPVSATAFGFDRARMIHAALGRLINSVKVQRCNCLEIDDVETRTFLGVPFVSFSAHPRHIQKGLGLAFSSHNSGR